ncbi:cystinosin [Neohortaea acidophila]|uniref:Cystinosin n=1 Tax=Neohortaea acidophila TaxID=245834 RepID=A0A6A6Q1U5_9PEZI|nr:cystinosin [Neohortaea acidophila]KAF2486458.1 cystinosin [Neohortaea acidophila]
MIPQLEQLARVVSQLCGWAYFFCWTLSFYPQIMLNIRRRTTEGYLPDYPLLNILGFSCYGITAAAFLYSPVIRGQYAARHPASPEPTVRFNDLAFAVHACLCSIVVYSQFWPRLWGWKPTTAVHTKAGRTSIGIIWGSLFGVVITIGIVLVSGNTTSDGGHLKWAWIDVINAISYVKLLVTVFKYTPQAISNVRRKSTIGFSIWQVLLDFSGGILSLLQLVIDSALQSTGWRGVTDNPLKFGLANISMLFDVIFMVQHYILFGPVEKQSVEGGGHGRRDSAAQSREEGESLLPATEHR